MASGIQALDWKSTMMSRPSKRLISSAASASRNTANRSAAMQLPRFRRDASGWLAAAFSTTSLPGILSNVANKMLLEGYNYIEDAWRKDL